jgi:hypothetical protein
MVVGIVDELAAELTPLPIGEPVGVDTPPDAVARFEHDDVAPDTDEVRGALKAGEAGADDDHVVATRR